MFFADEGEAARNQRRIAGLSRAVARQHTTPPATLAQASIILLRTAYRTSSLIEWQSRRLIILARWVSAVFTLNPRATATSLLLLPSASNCTISRCRGVSRLRASSFFSSILFGFLSR